MYLPRLAVPAALCLFLCACTPAPSPAPTAAPRPSSTESSAATPWTEDYNLFWDTLAENYPLWAVEERVRNNSMEELRIRYRPGAERAQSAQDLYKVLKGCMMEVDYTGTWRRTEEYIAMPATIVITNQTAVGFDFSVDAYYYSHTGAASGTARFVGDNVAYWRSEDETADGEAWFSMKNGQLLVEQAGQFPFGMNVGMGGTYTQDEPEYTTNGVLEALGPERVLLLKEAAGEDYQGYVGTPLTYGSFEIEEYQKDGFDGLLIEGWMPTMGYWQNIYIGNDGAVWINFQTGQTFTNRPEEDMPTFLEFTDGENG